MHTGLQVLRAKIRGLQAAGTSIHHRIHKSKGDKRNRLWYEKRDLGGYNREHLIAYGLLRGIPYERIEHCAKENRPSARRVFELMVAHADWRTARELSLEKVVRLLEVPEPPASSTASTTPSPDVKEPLAGPQEAAEKRRAS